jgi:hypothetical protein
MGKDRSFGPEVRRTISGRIGFPVLETVTSGLLGRGLTSWWSIWSGDSDQIDQTIKITGGRLLHTTCQKRTSTS